MYSSLLLASSVRGVGAGKLVLEWAEVGEEDPDALMAEGAERGATTGRPARARQWGCRRGSTGLGRPEWAEAGEEDPDASTMDDADARRSDGEADKGAAVGMTARLARIGKATVGEATAVDAAETEVGHSRTESKAEVTSSGGKVC